MCIGGVDDERGGLVEAIPRAFVDKPTKLKLMVAMELANLIHSTEDMSYTPATLRLCKLPLKPSKIPALLKGNMAKGMFNKCLGKRKQNLSRCCQLYSSTFFEAPAVGSRREEE